MATRTQMDPTRVHKILQNRRRRRVLEYMRTRPSKVTLKELAEQIAKMESDTSPPSRDLTRSVYNSLHQNHLPKLDDNGVVNYNTDRKTVDLLGKARSVNLYMEIEGLYGIPWSECYRYIGVIGFVLIVAHEISIPLVSDLPLLLIPSIFLMLLALSTGYQFWSQRWIYFRQLLE